jgi:hypothetical protein
MNGLTFYVNLDVNATILERKIFDNIIQFKSPILANFNAFA